VRKNQAEHQSSHQRMVRPNLGQNFLSKDAPKSAQFEFFNRHGNFPPSKSQYFFNRLPTPKDGAWPGVKNATCCNLADRRSHSLTPNEEDLQPRWRAATLSLIASISTGTRRIGPILWHCPRFLHKDHPAAGHFSTTYLPRRYLPHSIEFAADPCSMTKIFETLKKP